jgi:monoamine oxidase
MVAFMEGARGVEDGRLTADEGRALVIEQVERALGGQHQRNIGYVDCDCPRRSGREAAMAHVPPGVWTQFGPSLREPVGRMHWAGIETAERWMGYVDGAIE